MSKTQQKQRMFRFTLCYSARLKGASGVFWATWTTVDAKNIDEAKRLGLAKLNKTHDVYSLMSYQAKGI